MRDSWRDAQLKDLVSLQRGHDLPRQNRVQGTVPVIGAGGANGTHNVANVKGPGIVLGRSGAGFGSVWWCAQDFWAHNTALYVTDFKGNDPRYIYYRLQLIDFSKFNSGGLQPSLNRNFIYPIPIRIPPQAEQTGIAEILEHWDLAIDQYEHLIEAKELLQKAVARRLLTRCVLGANGLRQCKLGDLFDERDERGYDGDQLLAITGTRGVINRDELDRRDTSAEDKSKYKKIRPGDIGYNTMRMWQGVAGLSKLNGIVSPAYTIVTPRRHLISGAFAAVLFKLPQMIHQFRRYSQGLVDDTLSLKYHQFAEIPIFIPRLSEQEHIAEVLQTLAAAARASTAQLAAIERQRRGLMQKLLTGEWRLPLRDEEADVTGAHVFKEVAQ